LNLALGALLASATLFFVPLTLLAAVGPFLIRVLALSFSSIGSQVGRLSAISTLGSVIGTLLIGYVLIPFFPNSVTMYVTASVLCLPCLLYYFLWARKSPAIAVICALALVVGFIGVRHDLQPRWEKVKELYRGNSNFGMLQVVQLKNSPRRFYLNDFLVQNTYDSIAHKSTSLFTYMLRYLAQGYTTNLHNVLCIGMGVGIVPGQLARDGVQVDVIEINPAVIPVARDFFNFEPEKCRITIADGRYVINSTRSTYDAVVLDAFLGDSSPGHLMTREAFANIKRILNPNGVLVINSFGDLASGKDFFAASLAKTLNSVFPSVRAHGTGNGNLFFVASANPKLELHPVSTADAHPDVTTDVATCLASVLAIEQGDGRLLTDDFNPAEFYDAHNREMHRRSLAFSIRSLTESDRLPK
jgi:spermidine synthase